MVISLPSGLYQLGGTEQVTDQFIFISMEKVKVKGTQSCPTLCDPMDYTGQNTGVGSLSFLQGIFLTQGSNPGLLHCRRATREAPRCSLMRFCDLPPPAHAVCELSRLERRRDEASPPDLQLG